MVNNVRQVKEALNVDVVPVFVKMVKSTLLVEFVFYRDAHDLQSFQMFWGYYVYCSITDDQLVFGQVLL